MLLSVTSISLIPLLVYPPLFPLAVTYFALLAANYYFRVHISKMALPFVEGQF